MSKTNGRRFHGRRDILILAGLVIFSLLAMWWMRTVAKKDGNVAVVTLQGREIMRFYLSDYDGKTEHISLNDKYGVPVSFELENGGIRFVDVECPDHLCEAMGICRAEYEFAVCLPNQTAVAVYAPDDVPGKG